MHSIQLAEEKHYMYMAFSVCDWEVHVTKSWYSRWCYAISAPWAGYKCSILCTNFRFLKPGGLCVQYYYRHSTIGIVKLQLNSQLHLHSKSIQLI